MSIDIGIIGLPQSGKTTVFNALTKGKADTISHTVEGATPHIGIAKVPEPRLTVLDEILHPKKMVPVEARYIDVGASVRVLAQDKGISGELLNQLSNVDTLISTVRAFADESIPHPEGSLDANRDINTLNLELIFSDLAIKDLPVFKRHYFSVGCVSNFIHHPLHSHHTRAFNKNKAPLIHFTPYSIHHFFMAFNNVDTILGHTC